MSLLVHFSDGLGAAFTFTFPFTSGNPNGRSQVSDPKLPLASRSINLCEHLDCIL